MILILDTSIILASLVSSKKNHVRSIFTLAKEKKVILAVCEETINELKNSLQKQNIKKLPHFSSYRNSVFIAWYTYNSKWYSIANEKMITPLRDPNDLMYIQLAQSSKADYLITGDNDLLILKKYKNTHIVTPKEFIENNTSII